MDTEEALARLGEPWPRSNKLSCPLHSDSDPSLHLYEERWYCFSCLRHGDAYDLLSIFGEDVKRPSSGRSRATRGLSGHKTSQAKWTRLRAIELGAHRAFRELGRFPPTRLIDDFCLLREILHELAETTLTRHLTPTKTD